MRRFFLSILSLALAIMLCSCGINHCAICGKAAESEMDKGEALRLTNAWVSDYDNISWYHKTSDLIKTANSIKEINDKLNNINTNNQSIYVCDDCKGKINSERPTAHMCLNCGALNSYKKFLGGTYCDSCYEELLKLDTKNCLDFSNVSSNTNSLYNTVTGSVTNNGNHTVYFVKVKITYTDNQYNVIDTDTAYVCGEEGLAVGETSKFYSSVIRDNRFAYFKVEIYDWWDNL